MDKSTSKTSKRSASVKTDSPGGSKKIKVEIKKEIIDCDEKKKKAPTKRAKPVPKKTQKDGNSSGVSTKIKVEIKGEILVSDKNKNQVSASKEKPILKAKSTSGAHKIEIKIEVEDSSSDPDDKKSVKQKRPQTENPVNVSKKIKLEPKKEYIDLEWNIPQKLSSLKNVEPQVARNLIRLFKAGDTIPFIARYRKNVTNDMDSENLRDVKETYEELCSCKKKAEKIIDVIEKSGQLTQEIINSVGKSNTTEELEYIYEPYKPGKQKTLVARAKELNLYEPALKILEREKINFSNYINRQKDGLKTFEEIETGILNILSHEISINPASLEFVQSLRNDLKLVLKSKLKSKKVEDPGKKYQLYYDFRCPLQHLKPHQILAINRGEKQKILTVKINVPDSFAQHKFTQFCYGRFKVAHEHSKLLTNAIIDAYKRRIHPVIVRKAKTELNQRAEVSAIETFAQNLKNLLQTTPVKGKIILSIDPGFKIGCKVAVISKNGDILDTAVIYPHTTSSDADKEKIQNLISKHNCELIAIGNGTACRETESWISNLIQKKYFLPQKVEYTIIDECGASIYSCSPEAKKEFPDLDSLFISAVSLARRVQDPLSEMVKIEPQHLGVGMYQHDVNKKLLENTLNEIVSECVSFIGVDLNTASQCLLRRVAGLTDLRAKNFIEYRTVNGPFTNREQIKKVKGIGEKSFEQCAGFLRISQTNFDDSKNFNPLDCTIIHPESYVLTSNILKKYNFSVTDIGTKDFIKSFSKLSANISAKILAEEYGSTESTIKLILEALQRPFDYDLRDDSNLKPIFRSGVISLTDLKVNMILYGYVRNVTTFGAFVDIGVGKDGLIHWNNMGPYREVQLGNKVVVKILKIEHDSERISLLLVNIV